MTALHKLQEKIAAWKQAYEHLKEQNEALKVQIGNAAISQEENEKLRTALEAQKQAYAKCQEELSSLRRELEEKDAEIEKIVAQVEALLAS